MPEETGTIDAGIEETGSENQEKVFNQEQVNDIVQKRLARNKEEHEAAIKLLNDKITELEGRLKEDPAEEQEETEPQDDELAAALARIAELEKEKTDREAAEKRKADIAGVLKAHNVAAEYAPLLNHVPDEELDAMATLLGKRFAEPSKNERRRADVGDATDDEMREFAHNFLSGTHR